MSEYVFGYGSLAAEAPDRAMIASLFDHVRVWDVAMDNREEVGGYKYYVDAVSGERPDVCVTFLDVTLASGADCVGFLLPVDAERLTALDHRERNYDRVEVSDQIRADDPALLVEGDVVWTYVGKLEARERYASAVAAGRAVVARVYLETIERGFGRAGLWPRYVTSTRAPECPIAELTRVDLS